MNELCEHKASSLLARLYAVAGARLRKYILRCILRLEKGEMRSATARAIMQNYHGVEIAPHAYGCFDPDRFPPGVKIGRYVSIGPGVRIFRRNHPSDYLSLHPYFYNPACGFTKQTAIPSFPLEIEADSWIGAQSIILPGCRKIGVGAVIGAGSIVTRDIADLVIAGGNPCRVIRNRFADRLAERILLSQWWNNTPQQLALFLQDMQRPLRNSHPALNKIGNIE